ncbi:hypothetical protein [Stenotrophomonas forensis]|uniref:hypothetical protein n=1 Tax=Stenotrophomonas forensis TaxID=2871169 RepID=UPI0039C60575
MSNDKTTLADAQPGGRVRLGDQAERARFEDWGLAEGLPLARGRLGGYAFEVTAKAWLAWQHLSAQPSLTEPGGLNYERMFVDACAALAEVSRELGCDPEQGGAEPILAAIAELRAAQPSPGGQGDALAAARELLAAEYDKAGERVFADRARKGQYDNDPDVRAIVAALAARQPVGRSFQAGVAEWMGQCFLPSLYSNMTERGDRLLEEVLELLQAHGYDSARVPTLVDYVFGRPVGEPTQEVGGVMVTLAGYCWVAGLDMHAAGDAELARISQPDVMAKIRAKQEAKNALHFDTPLPGNAACQPVGEPVAWMDPDGSRVLTAKAKANASGAYKSATSGYTVPLYPAAQAVDLGQQQDAARWRAIAPHLQVEWDEDELLKRWTWIDVKSDALSVPTRSRKSYASLNEAMDAVIDSQAVGNG